MKFDIILTNPPFNLGEKMLIKWFDIADEICTVQPSTWLLGKKQKKDIVKNVDAWGKTEIESIQGSEHFDAAISGEIAIQHFIKGKENKSHYDKQERITFDGKGYNKCEEITNFSNDELLVEFENIVKPLYLKDNLHNHLKNIPGALHFNGNPEYNPNPKWWCMRMQGMRGHKGTNDFYSLISNQEKELLKLRGQYKELSLKKIIQTNKGKGAVKKPYMEFYYHFNTKKELYNFINYIKTDFVRILLYMYKTTIDLISGKPLSFVPWFDFSDPVFSKSPSEIDDYLFAKYIPEVDEETGITRDEIRKHIENLLPDYYSIRKIKGQD